MVWVMAKYMVRALFIAGHDEVIIDATNTTRSSREFWSKDYDCRFWVVKNATNRDLCYERAQQGGRLDLIPVIRRLYATFEPLGEDEIEYDGRELEEEYNKSLK